MGRRYRKYRVAYLMGRARANDGFLCLHLCLAPATVPCREVVHHLVQGCGGDDFSGLAVSALTLLRHSDNSSGSADLGAVTPVQIVRRHPRKPPKATIRALF